MFRGTINVDYTGQITNEYTRLKLALTTAGWLHVETSAFVRDTPNIDELWRGIALVAKQSASAGQLSALTFHIQASDDFNQSIPIQSTLSPGNALADIEAKPYPGI